MSVVVRVHLRAPVASEITTIWHYRNLITGIIIIIIIIFIIAGNELSFLSYSLLVVNAAVQAGYVIRVLRL